MSNLFVKQDFISHSGKELDFKIECDALTDEDIETLSYIISKKFNFFGVIGIPRGGLRLAKALEKYKTMESSYLLLADDVLTTGKSMRGYRDKYIKYSVIGTVLFARGKCPDWVIPLFQMWREE